MHSRTFLGTWCSTLFGLLLMFAWPGHALSGDKDKQASAAKGEFAKEIEPFLTKYCTTCHSGEKPKGGVDFAKYKDMVTASKHSQVWEKVLDQLRAGEMPPAGKPKPSAEQVERFSKWVNEQFLAFDCTKQRDPGRVTFRRLNRNEYNNTIRDLFGIKFKPADDFPADDVADVFDNNSDVLAMSPLLMEKYLASAEKVVDEVFRRPELKDKVIVAKLPGIPEGPGFGKGPGKGFPPPKGPGPGFGKVDPKAKELAFKAALEPFLRKAFRRPVTTEEVARYTRFITVAEKNGEGLDRALQIAMQAALCSPHFLFRVEKDFVITGDVIAQPIGPYELASRLSYFLWSSMPDEDLFAAAAKGNLREKAVLEAQVRRMLKDAKAQALVENFAGQWLQLRSVAQMTPDPKLFPSYDAKLGAAMVKETELFFDHLFKEDRSLMECLDADWTFLNERLAKHYGFPGIKGEQFQKVKLTGDQRVGLLTHASILSVTSNPTRTSPVKRGKWILDNILNTPPPPPPPDAGELSEDEKDISAAPLRKRLEQHRTNAVCASCHQRMDPLGFGFENFDAIGAWRTKDGKFNVDASGELPGGLKFNGPKELVAALKKKDAEFRRCVVEKMLTYALGRGLKSFDRCAIDDICAEVARQDNRSVSLVLAIVQSDPFLLKRGQTAKK